MYIVDDNVKRDELFVLNKKTGEILDFESIDQSSEDFNFEKTLSGIIKIYPEDESKYYFLGHYRMIYGKFKQAYPLETIKGYEVMIPVEFILLERYPVIIRQKDTNDIIAVPIDQLLNILEMLRKGQNNFGESFVESKSFISTKTFKKKTIKFRFWNYLGTSIDIDPWLFQLDILKEYQVEPKMPLGIAELKNKTLVKPIKIGDKYYASSFVDDFFKFPYPIIEGWKSVGEYALSDGNEIVVFYPIEKIIDEICVNNTITEKKFILSLAKRKLGKIIFYTGIQNLYASGSVEILRENLIFSTKQQIKKFLNDLV